MQLLRLLTALLQKPLGRDELHLEGLDCLVGAEDLTLQVTYRAVHFLDGLVTFSHRLLELADKLERVLRHEELV